jgi:plastocyanin
MNPNGTWYNELGSTMTLTAVGGNIQGVYQSGVGAEGTFQLTGSYDPSNEPNIAIGFVVTWANAYNNYHSVTGWSGQIQGGTIVATWLLTSETNNGDDWKSTLVGKDIFTQAQPSTQHIAASKEKGMVNSHPM